MWLSLFGGLASCQGPEDSPPGIESGAGGDTLPEEGRNAPRPEDPEDSGNIPPPEGLDDSPPLEDPEGLLEEQSLEPSTIVANPKPGPDIVRRENQLPGTRDWRIRRPANKREIEGYALVATVTPGQRVPVAVQASEARTFQWFVYRMGHYGGAGGRLVARGGPLQAARQPACPMNETTGMVACQWTPTFQIQTAADWVRGVYLVKLVRDDGYERYVPFFVRDADPRAEVVAVIPTATWVAYNTWGGTSLYDDSVGMMRSKHGVGRAFQVSYDRPYARGHGTGHLVPEDLSLVQWLEAQGVDVAYATDEALEESEAFLRGAKAIFLSGHDEYWTGAIRDQMDRAVAAGTSLINLGSNQGYWQTRLEPAKDGRPRRIVTCYKGDSRDPVGLRSPARTVKFRDPPVSRPENQLFGVMFKSRWHQFPFPMVITNPGHWALAGTGLRAGDTIWMANGYEVDQIVDNGKSPAGLEVLAESPMLSLQGAFGFGQMVVRQQGSAWVFSAGSVDFVRTLAGEKTADPRVGRIVANVLYRALGRAVPSTMAEFSAPLPPAPRGPFARQVRTVGGQPGMRARLNQTRGPGQLAAPVAVAVLPSGAWVVADALAGAVKRISLKGEIQTVLTGLNGPMGVAADAKGNIYVADTEHQVIRRITPDGKAAIFSGAEWAAGHKNGPAINARFNQPAGLTMAPDGALLVMDMGNGVVRRIDLKAAGNPVTTVPADQTLYRASAVAAKADGTLYVVETGMSRVVEIKGGKVSPVAGSTMGYADGAPASAQMMPYLGIAVLADGSVAVADPGNYRIRRILFGADGKAREVTTLAGSGRFGARDGDGQSAEFVLPAGLAVGRDGTLYVADSGNALLRAVTP
jgi:sugar lactone lactonase YvrE